jgi:demethylmenaquinone methyltransferase/2-methoxy-6-polyprenyl-1,4-benzoquinol methylase
MQQIRTFFDKRAHEWDASMAPEIHERLREIVAGLDLAPGQRVLDVGCGTGVLGPLAGPRIAPGGFMASVDVSGEMVRLARRKNLPRNVFCVQADALDPPFPEKTFDWVICYSVFPHFENHQGALRRLTASLAEGGRLAVCHSSSREAINALHNEVGGVVGGHCLPEASAMKRLFHEAGLRVEQLFDGSDRYIAVGRNVPA